MVCQRLPLDFSRYLSLVASEHEIFHSLDTLASLKCSLIKRWFSPLSLAHRVRGAQAIFSPQHFLKPSLGCAGINLWAFSPSAPATASSLNHFPADFIGHAVVALLACFLFSPPPAACFRFAAGRGGGLSLWGLAPRTYFVFETRITDILILLYLYDSFVIYAPPHIRAGGKMATIVCRAANLRRMRFLCAARKITLETKNRRKTHLRRRGERHKKAPRFSAGGRGVKLEGKRGAGGGENSFNHLLLSV